MSDLMETPQQLELRAEIRSWLATNRPKEGRPEDYEGIREYDLAWQRTLYEAGWAGIDWPQEFGGRGLTLSEQLIWYEEAGRAGVPPMNSTFVAFAHAGPTLIACGSPQQQSEHLPKILRGEAIWCQGFSEPGSGSDLASLSTRGRVDGDELVVSGQKIWTSYAPMADFQELLVRTGEGPRKHDGITWAICDMRSPGIEIRPIRTMNRGAEFAEVFYDEVRIPLSNVVGEVGGGWRVAMSTLAFERGTAMMASQVQLSSLVDELISEARRRSAGRDGLLIDDIEVARSLATVKAEVAALRAMTYLSVARAEQEEVPGSEGSIVKLRFGELGKEVERLAMSILGRDSLTLKAGGQTGDWGRRYLSSFAETIAGGTSEIQRNIIGERVLGLPR